MFVLEGTPGTQKTLVSRVCTVTESESILMTDRDFQDSATAQLGVGKCGIRGWGRCAKMHPCFDPRWPGQALHDCECRVTGSWFAVEQFRRFITMAWILITVNELLSITIRPRFHAEILARQSDQILLSRLQNRCQLTINTDITPIHQESISPIPRPIHQR